MPARNPRKKASPASRKPAARKTARRPARPVANKAKKAARKPIRKQAAKRAAPKGKSRAAQVAAQVARHRRAGPSTPIDKELARAEHDHQDPRWAQAPMASERVPGTHNYGQEKNRAPGRLPNTVNWFRKAPKHG